MLVFYFCFKNIDTCNFRCWCMQCLSEIKSQVFGELDFLFINIWSFRLHLSSQNYFSLSLTILIISLKIFPEKKLWTLWQLCELLSYVNSKANSVLIFQARSVCIYGLIHVWSSDLRMRNWNGITMVEKK